MGAEAVLRTILAPDVTSATEDTYAELHYFLFSGSDPESQAIGVQHVGGPEPVIAVTDPARPVGSLRIETQRPGVLLFLDNRAWRGSLHATVRVLGADSALIVHDIGDGFAGLDIFLRSDRQVLFWGDRRHRGRVQRRAGGRRRCRGDRRRRADLQRRLAAQPRHARAP